MNGVNEAVIIKSEKTFLDQLWVELNHATASDWDNVTVVFPNNRTGFFFRKTFAKNAAKVTWLPKIMSIKDFVMDRSSLSVADPFVLLIRLYESYSVHVSSPRSFEDFIPWGEIILKDFDELDKYLVPAEQLFKEIKELKEIDLLFDSSHDGYQAFAEFWGAVKVSRDSGEKKAFLDFWNSLYKIYFTFTQALIKEGLCYEGMAYKKVASEICVSGSSAQRIFFAGFNALTESDRSIIQTYLENGSSIYWDADVYYLLNRRHEAGRYLRKFSSLPNTRIIVSEGFNREKSVTTVGTPLNVGQVNIASEIIKSLSEKEGSKAVVLPDEKLLVPLLSALPPDAPVNVTMGVPVASTSVYSLLQQLSELKVYGPLFQSSSLLEFLINPLVDAVTVGNSSRIAGQIIKNNHLQVHESVLLSELPEMKGIFMCNRDLLSRMLQLLSLFDKLKDMLPVEARAVREMQKVILYLRESLQLLNLELSDTAAQKMLQKQLAAVKIPLQRETDEGIEIMGFLETRNLDFNHVAILSVNEGILPSSGSDQSLIPASLKKAFGMLTSEGKDAITSYYFYRLLQRTKQVHLVFNSQPGTDTAGERSRFISQLQVESEVSMQDLSVNNTILSAPQRSLQIQKDDLILSKLRSRFSTRALSSSAITSFLDCRLKFALRYVLDVEEPEELLEDIDPATFGIIVHFVLEKIYKTHLHDNPTGVVDKQHVKEFIRTVQSNDSLLDEAFRCSFDVASKSLKGRAFLLREVARKYILNLLHADLEHAPFTILGLETGWGGEEQSLETTIDVDGMQVKLAGKIDRLDQKDGVKRVVDYKTGRADLKFISVAHLFSDEIKSRNSKAFQGMFYAWLLHRKDRACRKSVAIMSAPDLNSEGASPYLRMKKEPAAYRYDRVLDEITEDLLYEFEERITAVVKSIFDAGVPFTQTAEEDTCTYCPYTTICSRN